MPSDHELPELLNEIKSRGYWRVMIRPLPYDQNRLRRNSLEDLVGRCKVSLRGWDFPHMSSHSPIERHDGFIQQASEWAHFLEFWRFYRSGQFLYIAGIGEDWRDRSHVWKGTYNPASRRIAFVDTIYHFTEIFEFAARLAVTDFAGRETEISIGLRGLQNRTAYMDHRHMDFGRLSSVSSTSWERRWAGPTSDLVARRSRLAVEMLGDFWDLFGLDISQETIEYHQGRLLEGTA